MSRHAALALTAVSIALASCGPATGGTASQEASVARVCAPGEPAYSSKARPIIEHYCVRCHSPEGVAGDEHDFTHPELLRAERRLVSARLRAQSMPPPGSPQPSGVEAALVIQWLDCGAALD
jgi:hypothetical protein